MYVPAEGSMTQSHSDEGFLCHNFFLDPSGTFVGICRSLRCCWRWSWAGCLWTCLGVSCTDEYIPEHTHREREREKNPVTEERRKYPMKDWIFFPSGGSSENHKKNHTWSSMWKTHSEKESCCDSFIWEGLDTMRVLDKEMQIPPLSPESPCYHVKNVLILVTNQDFLGQSYNNEACYYY